MFLKYHEVLSIFMRRLPNEPFNDEIFRANAELLFRACIELLRGDEDGFDTLAAVALLNQIELGYACWLEDIRTAINLAEKDFPAHYKSFYQRFLGASAMAEAYLFTFEKDKFVIRQ